MLKQYMTQTQNQQNIILYHFPKTTISRNQFKERTAMNKCIKIPFLFGIHSNAIINNTPYFSKELAIYGSGFDDNNGIMLIELTNENNAYPIYFVFHLQHLRGMNPTNIDEIIVDGINNSGFTTSNTEIELDLNSLFRKIDVGKMETTDGRIFFATYSLPIGIAIDSKTFRNPPAFLYNNDVNGVHSNKEYNFAEIGGNQEEVDGKNFIEGMTTKNNSKQKKRLDNNLKDLLKKVKTKTTKVKEKMTNKTPEFTLPKGYELNCNPIENTDDVEAPAQMIPIFGKLGTKLNQMTTLGVITNWLAFILLGVFSFAIIVQIIIRLPKMIGVERTIGFIGTLSVFLIALILITISNATSKTKIGQDASNWMFIAGIACFFLFFMLQVAYYCSVKLDWFQLPELYSSSMPEFWFYKMETIWEIQKISVKFASNNLYQLIVGFLILFASQILFVYFSGVKLKSVSNILFISGTFFLYLMLIVFMAMFEGKNGGIAT
jgi:hypothetical protein